MIELTLTEILNLKNDAPAGAHYVAKPEKLDKKDIKIGFANPDIFLDLSGIETSGKVVFEGYNKLSGKGLVSRGYGQNAVVIEDGDGLIWDGMHVFDAGGAGVKINASFVKGGQKNIDLNNWVVDNCGGSDGQSDNFAIHRGGHFTENVIVRNLISTNAKVEEELDITTEFARNILIEGGEFSKVNIGHGAQAHLKNVNIDDRLFVKSSEGVVIEGGNIAKIVLLRQSGGVQGGKIPRGIRIDEKYKGKVTNNIGAQITWFKPSQGIPDPIPEPGDTTGDPNQDTVTLSRAEYSELIDRVNYLKASNDALVMEVTEERGRLESIRKELSPFVRIVELLG